MKNKPNLPSWAKLLITQPAPDTTFSAMPAPASR